MWDLSVSLVLGGLAAVVSSHAPRLEITFPAQHSRWQVSNGDGLLETLPVHFRTRNFHVPSDGFLLVTGENVPDDEGYRHLSDASSLLMGGIDPGSHFWKLELRAWNDSATALADAMLHVEVVVDPSDARSPWRYKLREAEKRPLVLVNPKDSQDQRASSSGSKGGRLPVCYVSSSSGAFDGQRRMWLQIMQGLGTGSNDRFQFEVKIFEQVVTEAPLTRALRKLNVSLQGLPLEIPRNELSEEGVSPDGVVGALLSSFYRQFPLARHDSRHISMLEQPALVKLRPPYAAQVWKDLVDSLRSPCADGLIIFSNSRSLSDELLVLAARLAGPRAIVMELANLHPTRVNVDILLAPSHFAKEHFSVARNVRARNTVVLSTGVDTQRFAPSAVPLSEDEHFVIGYVGRLSSEKSLGILLAAMKTLAPICPQCRLRVVGDGPQKSELTSLATEWGLLSSSVEFVDGIYNDEPALVREFRKMHVFASPMLTETLGLAVLEAMSVGLPVVGFISAGTGEFLEDGQNCLAVWKATPSSFADAILTLVNDRDLRLRLGSQARHTVIERFSTHAALEQYARLYERAGRPLNNRTQDKCAPFTGEFCEFEA
ncbi:hypothetical protein PHYPSEUDO_002265 [Phytophthora pseudosyringae]|uniref:Glycosyl transferase family 1 domain-containing protein n=1 Tax=Phytophthora pseudosyringae TaxID=221518 RepID=A0A8T1VUV3_9STRA|nr:hypothetical protein PHYPSEUDO_002265 [Phytophthora pseudosyringae]